MSNPHAGWWNNPYLKSYIETERDTHTHTDYNLWSKLYKSQATEQETKTKNTVPQVPLSVQPTIEFAIGDANMDIKNNMMAYATTFPTANTQRWYVLHFNTTLI